MVPAGIRERTVTSHHTRRVVETLQMGFVVAFAIDVRRPIPAFTAMGVAPRVAVCTE